MNQFKQALFDRLRSTANVTAQLAGTAAVYDSLAPQDADEPYIVFNEQAATDSYTFGGRAWEDGLWQVKCITRGPTSKVGGSVAARVDQALTNSVLTVDGHTNLMLRRESKIDYVESEDGEQWRHQGGIYRAYLQQT